MRIRNRNFPGCGSATRSEAARTDPRPYPHPHPQLCDPQIHPQQLGLSEFDYFLLSVRSLYVTVTDLLLQEIAAVLRRAELELLCMAFL